MTCQMSEFVNDLIIFHRLLIAGRNHPIFQGVLLLMEEFLLTLLTEHCSGWSTAVAVRCVGRPR